MPNKCAVPCVSCTWKIKSRAGKRAYRVPTYRSATPRVATWTAPGGAKKTCADTKSNSRTHQTSNWRLIFRRNTDPQAQVNINRKMTNHQRRNLREHEAIPRHAQPSRQTPAKTTRTRRSTERAKQIPPRRRQGRQRGRYLGSSAGDQQYLSMPAAV